WGFRGRPGVERASLAVYVGALAALADGAFRLSGGERPGAALGYLVDPRPERWGRRSLAGTLHALSPTEAGLSSVEAQRRQRPNPPPTGSTELLAALRNQLRSPITGILAGGTGLALFLGEVLNASIIGATIAINVAAGVWQERQIGRA